MLLLARIYELFPLRCPDCGADMRIIAFVTEAPAVQAILAHRGEPTAPPRPAPARGPPLWEMADTDPGASNPRTAPFDPQALYIGTK